MVEGTPLLREHAVMSCIEGSNPSNSANRCEAPEEKSSGAFLMPEADAQPTQRARKASQSADEAYLARGRSMNDKA